MAKILNDAGKNCTSLASQNPFAHKSSGIYTIKKAPYGKVFGTKPQVPMSLKLGFCADKYTICCWENCNDLPSHCHSENNLNNRLPDNLLQPQYSQSLWSASATSNESTLPRLKDVENKLLFRNFIKIDSNWDNTSTYAENFSFNITFTILHRVKIFIKDHSDHSQSLNLSRF